MANDRKRKQRVPDAQEDESRTSLTEISKIDTNFDESVADMDADEDVSSEASIDSCSDDTNDEEQFDGSDADDMSIDETHELAGNVDVKNFGSANADVNNMLQYFWDLAHHEPEARQKSTAALVQHLITHQKPFAQLMQAGEVEFGVLTESAENAEEAWADCMTKRYASDVLYALNRLVRGLSSPRMSARQGFALALNEVLHAMQPAVPVAYVLHLVNKQTKITGGMKGSEERDALFGRVFCYFAMLRSGLLLNESVMRCADLRNIVADLVSISAKKPFLRELGFQFLLSCAKEISPKSPLWNSYIEAVISEVLSVDRVSKFHQTADYLVLVDTLQRKDKSRKWKVLLETDSTLPYRKRILHPKNLSYIASVFKESTAESHPRIHSAWVDIFSALMDAADHDNLLDFTPDFWRAVVDESLFTSSHERKYLGFQLLEIFLPRLISCGVHASTLFSPNLVRCLLNNLSNTSNSLYKCANHTAESVFSVAKMDRTIAMQFIASDFLEPIRKVFKNKALVDSITDVALAGTPEESMKAVSDHLDWLEEKFMTESASADMDARRRWCLDQMIAVVKSPSITKSKALLLRMLRFIVDSIVVPAVVVASDGDGDKRTTVNVQEEPLRKFWIFVTESFMVASSGSADPKRTTLEFPLHDVVRLIKEKKSMQNAWTDDLRSLCYQAEKYADAVEKEMDPSKKRTMLAVLDMWDLLLLQMLFSADTERSSDTIRPVFDDLKMCWGKKFESSSIAEKFRPSSVLCDVIGLVLDQLTSSAYFFSSKLTRKVVETVFKTNCADLDAEGMQVLLHILDPLGSYGEQEDVSEEEEPEGAEILEEKTDSDDSISESSLSSDGEDSGDLDEAFVGKLKAAFAQQNQGNSSDEDEELLTDEQMLNMGFDEKIAEVFKSRKLEKRQKHDILKSTVDFKYRILDLAEIYLRIGREQTHLFGQNVVRLALGMVRSVAVHKDPQTYFRLSKAAKLASNSASFHLQNLCETPLQQRKNYTDRGSALIRSILKTRVSFGSADAYLQAINAVTQFLSGSKPFSNDDMLNPLPFPMPILPMDLQGLCNDLLIWLVKNYLLELGHDGGVLEQLTEVYSIFTRLHLEKHSKRIPASFLMSFIQTLCGIRTDRSDGTQFVWTIMAEPLLDRFAIVPDDQTKEPFWNYRRYQCWSLFDFFLKFARLADAESGKFVTGKLLPRFLETVRVVVDQLQKAGDKKNVYAKKTLPGIASFLRKLKKSSASLHNRLSNNVEPALFQGLGKLADDAGPSSGIAMQCGQIARLLQLEHE